MTCLLQPMASNFIRQALPVGIGYELSGQLFQEILSGKQASILFALSLLGDKSDTGESGAKTDRDVWVC